MLPQNTKAMIFGCHGPNLLPKEKKFFSTVNPFGFILFARNVESANQLKALCADLRDAVGWNAPILIDQEGGRVQRIRAPMATEWPAPFDHGSEGSVDAIFDRYHLIGLELLSYGVDVNCAPCLDIARPETHPFLQNRCFADNLDQVISMGRAAMDGHLEAGVIPVIKHMPGHGLARSDTHKELPTVPLDRDYLFANDFAAFSAFADAPMAMTAHIVFSAFDERPSTISPVMINLIREEIGFKGFLMSDDISMQALPGKIEERARASIDAGCDVALHCNGDYEEMRTIAQNVPVLSNKGRHRAQSALALRRDQRPTELDIKELSAKLLGH